MTVSLMVSYTERNRYEIDQRVKVGYSRVSTTAHDVDAQHAFLLIAGVDAERIYTDVDFTGKNASRAELHQEIAAARAGDTLVVPKMDRFARNLEDTLSQDITFFDGSQLTEVFSE